MIREPLERTRIQVNAFLLLKFSNSGFDERISQLVIFLSPHATKFILDGKRSSHSTCVP